MTRFAVGIQSSIGEVYRRKNVSCVFISIRESLENKRLPFIIIPTADHIKVLLPFVYTYYVQCQVLPSFFHSTYDFLRIISLYNYSGFPMCPLASDHNHCSCSCLTHPRALYLSPEFHRVFKWTQKGKHSMAVKFTEIEL